MSRSNDRAGSGRRSTRETLLRLHRSVGLFISLFLIVAGATGALISFKSEIIGLFGPANGIYAPAPDQQLPAEHLHRAVEQRFPAERLSYIHLKPSDRLYLHVPFAPDATRPDGPTGAYVRVTDGRVFGPTFTSYDERLTATERLMHWIVELHYRLLLPGEMGVWLMGVVALLWFLDCFTALAVTAPNKTALRKSFLIRTGKGSYKLTFDLHRATAVWLWPLLGLLALSSIAYNLPQPTRTAVGLMSDLSPVIETDPPYLAVPLTDPPLGWEAALVRVRTLMADRAQTEGFRVNWEQFIDYDATRGTYRYQVHSTKDIVDGDGCCGRTSVAIDARTGALIGWQMPVGKSGGDAFLAVMPALHTGLLFGLPHRILLALLGAASVGLSVTGLMIWKRKRTARLEAAQRPPRRIGKRTAARQDVQQPLDTSETP